MKKIMEINKLPEDSALFIYCDKKLVKANERIGKLYNQHKNKDGFLYLKITENSVLG